MKLKKIIRYFLIVLFISTCLLVFLANSNMEQIYGGLTKTVSFHSSELPGMPVRINNVSILSEDGNSFLPNRSIQMENGVITAIDTMPVHTDSITTINGKGKFLIPGLIDSHVHLFKSKNDLLLYIANGVTGIREMIGEEAHLDWREEIRNGRIGPDMYIASPRLGSFRQLEGWWMQWSQGFNNIRNAKEAEARVSEYAEKGYDAVKIYSYLDEVSYKAVNKAAIRHGMDVVGHVPFTLNFADIIRADQTELSHLEEVMNAIRREFGSFENEEGAKEFLEYTDKRSKELAPLLLAGNISVTTTLWLTQSFVRQKFELDKVLQEVALAYENPGISEWDKNIPEGLGWLPEVNRYKLSKNLDARQLKWQRLYWEVYGKACALILRNLHRGGVRIMAGTDANLPPAVPGFSLHDELEALTSAGLTASQALQTATVLPAVWLGQNTGKIAVGYKANAVLLEDNPMIHIANTRKINTVFLGGKVLDRAFLDDMLEAVKTANNNSRNEAINQFL